MRFSLQDATDGGSSGWLDGDTLRLAFVLRNKSTGPIFFTPDHPACLIRRLRVLVAGVEVHDIQDYGRVMQMFSILQLAARRMNAAAEGFGSSTAAVPDRPDNIGSFSQPIRAPKLNPGASRRVLSSLLAPIFSAQKFLPLALMGGIVIEAELDNYNACFAKEDGTYESLLLNNPTIDSC